jgi:hypothetical protein
MKVVADGGFSFFRLPSTKCSLGKVSARKEAAVLFHNKLVTKCHAKFQTNLHSLHGALVKFSAKCATFALLSIECCVNGKEQISCS